MRLGRYVGARVPAQRVAPDVLEGFTRLEPVPRADGRRRGSWRPADWGASYGPAKSSGLLVLTLLAAGALLGAVGALVVEILVLLP